MCLSPCVIWEKLVKSWFEGFEGPLSKPALGPMRIYSFESRLGKLESPL